jgi:hypothetical protein
VARSIVFEIAKYVNDYLKQIMQDEILNIDPTRANLVRPGLLQQSPVEAGINVTTDFNDPDDAKSWRHGISAYGDTLGIPAVPYEVGGGQMWYRRDRPELRQFFLVSANRLQAEEAAQIILSRAEQGILDAPLPPKEDDFGEIALKNYVHSSVNTEGGGPGQFIFNGYIWWQCLTDKNSAT